MRCIVPLLSPPNLSYCSVLHTPSTWVFLPLPPTSLPRFPGPVWFDDLVCFHFFFLVYASKRPLCETRPKRYWQSRASPLLASHSSVQPLITYLAPAVRTRPHSSLSSAHTRVRTSSPVSSDLISCAMASGRRASWTWLARSWNTSPARSLCPKFELSSWLPKNQQRSCYPAASSYMMHAHLLVGGEKAEVGQQQQQQHQTIEAVRKSCNCPSMILRTKATHPRCHLLQSSRIFISYAGHRAEGNI